MPDESDVAHTPGLSPTIIGSSAALRQLVSLALHVAATSAKVLITGESGVGKDVLARFIHAQSSRAARCFVALNCAGVAESLLESELFGHVRGSFTGAYRDKVGCLERAHRGTIFLDEIGDMGSRMQGMLLRFLETGEIHQVGSDGQATHVDVRIISATNRSLYEMVKRGEFREDLYYRIHVVHLEVPPLRKRVDDIRPLLSHLTAESGGSLAFTEEALCLLERHRWSGNVRELKNVVEYLVSLVNGRPVEPADLPRAIVASQPAFTGVFDERRYSIAAQSYDGLRSGELRFWEDVHRLFMSRDLTRADLRDIIRRGLEASAGSYRGLLRLFGLEQEDYKRLLNFLAAHDCSVDARGFRLSDSHATSASGQRRRSIAT